MRRYYIPGIVFAASFLYYGFQTCPTYYFWDSAELTAAVVGGGVPHPPGFPSLLFLSKLWLKILLVPDAFALNLFSSFFASIGLSLWYLVIVEALTELPLSKRRGELSAIALVATVLLGFSFTYSIQAVRFEVYSLNFACFAAIFYIVLKTVASGSMSRFTFAVMIVIIAIALGGHHLTFASALPGILLFLYLHDKLKVKYTGYGALGAALLLIPIYYSIILLARGGGLLNWGDPSNWKRFSDYFFLTEFTTSLSSFSPGHIAKTFIFVFDLISKQVGFLALIIGFWGIIRLIKVLPKLGVSLLLIMIFNIFSILYFEDFFYENYDLHGYLLIGLAVFIIFIAAAFMFILDLIRSRLSSKSKESPVIMGYVILILLAFIVIGLPIKKNISSADLSTVTTAGSFAEMFMADSPNNAIIISSYYNTYFCLLANEAINKTGGGRYITNVYNWDHGWGRMQTSHALAFNAAESSDRPEFYMTMLNSFKSTRPIFIEYDRASAPLAKYLKPDGLGYLFSVSDTLLADISPPDAEIESYLKIANKDRNIESIRTWIFWFQKRGEFFQRREKPDIAQLYFEAVDKLASMAILD